MNYPKEMSSLADSPNPSAVEIQRLAARELSLPSRLGYTLLLLAGLGAAGITGSLLLTEQALPARTRVAFAVMTVMGVSWAGFATWVLANRRVLFAQHRVVAASMAVAFTALYTLASIAMGVWGEVGRPWMAAAGLGVVMLAVAVMQLVRARQRFAELSRRRQELERRLGHAGRVS